MLNKKKYLLSENIELIEFMNLPDYQNLPYIFGDKDEFESLYSNLKKIDFPIDIIKKYSFFETGRWDLKLQMIISLNFLQNIT